MVTFFDHYLRERHKLDPGVEDLGVGIDGLAFPDGRIRVSEDTYVGAVNGEGYCRETMAHEGFHGIYHCKQIKSRLVRSNNLVLYRRQGMPDRENPEWQADAFAMFLLMPRMAVCALAKRVASIRDLPTAVANTFGVTQKAAMHRLRALKLIAVEQQAGPVRRTRAA